MPEPKRPLKVFLCHAHADRDAVRALYTRLTQDGVDAWLDKEKLLPGQDWELEIRKAVREADVVVVCLSKQFNQAGFRQKEVRLALDTAMEKPEGEIFIIPARLEECENLESLRRWHWVDLFEDDGYEMLMRALRARANRIGATLQIKKSWLPKITSPLSKPAKPIEENNLETPKKKSAKEKNDIPGEPPSDNFPDGWDDEWRRGFESASNVEKNKLKKQKGETVETSKPKVNQLQPKKTKSLRKPNPAIVVAVIGAIATIIAGLLGSPLIERWFSPGPIATELATATFTLSVSPIVPTQTLEVIQPIKTPTIVVARTESFTPTVTLLPTEIMDSKGVSMMLVPAGEFIMGSEDGDDGEKPVHTVYLDFFYMDKYEVTNDFYRECVNAGSCQIPNGVGYYVDPNYKNHPVVNVDWDKARIYCEWRGGSLPTEAQWEKAARGTDGRIYPWGNQFDGIKLNFCDKNCPPWADYADRNVDDGYADTAPVGSYEGGKSPYGIYDMVGNVWEWVADWYDPNYYASSPSINPLGPDGGYGYHVLRGGDWQQPEDDQRTYTRFGTPVDGYYGFRCSRNSAP